MRSIINIEVIITDTSGRKRTLEKYLEAVQDSIQSEKRKTTLACQFINEVGLKDK